MTASLLAVSDLHVSSRENRQVVERIRPGSDDDWLVVAGDIGEILEATAWALGILRDRFTKVIWAPGNHELWSHPSDSVNLRGVARYDALVTLCRRLDVITPEDDYPVWTGIKSEGVVAPLFVLYDYSWTAPGATTKEESRQCAYDAGIVRTDEFLMFPDPYPNRESWCLDRLRQTERRLAATDDALPTVLISHWPLRREPTEIMWHPEFAQWCGTDRTSDWHLRFRAMAVIYGHLRIPRTTWYDGVPFEEVSLGYPREWSGRRHSPQPVRRILSAGS